MDLFERLHRVRAEHDRRSWHICLMIAIDRGECLREDGAIDWVAVEARLGRCPEGKRSRGAPGASPDKKRLLGEAVEILKTKARFSLNDACSIVAEVVRFTRHVRNPARTIEEAWREYSCGKPDGDGRRVYRYAMLRLEGAPSLLFSAPSAVLPSNGYARVRTTDWTARSKLIRAVPGSVRAGAQVSEIQDTQRYDPGKRGPPCPNWLGHRAPHS